MKSLVYGLLAIALFAAGWYCGSGNEESDRELAELKAEYEKLKAMGDRGSDLFAEEIEPLEAKVREQNEAMLALRKDREAANADTKRLDKDVARAKAEYDKVVDALFSPLARLRGLAPKRYGSMTLEELKYLRELDLSGSAVTDDDLAMLADLPSLRMLTLRNTAITDEGLRHLAKLDRLDHLGLRDTKITDDGVAHLAGMDKLKGFDVNMTAVTDEGLRHVAGMKSLTFLRLNYTKITDAGLVHLKGLKKLERLDLWGTAITSHPDHLRDLTWLKHLELGATPVSKEWVEDFKAANPDAYVRSRWGK